MPMSISTAMLKETKQNFEDTEIRIFMIIMYNKIEILTSFLIL